MIELDGMAVLREARRMDANAAVILMTGFGSMEGAVEDRGPFCNACFSGNYEAPLVDVQKGYISLEDASGC